MTDDDRPTTQRETASKGGIARAQNLSAEERSRISSLAAQARWRSRKAVADQNVPKAIASGVLPVGNIPCAVLDDADNTRVLTQTGFMMAIGRNATPKSGPPLGFAELPAFLRAKNLEPFISNDLRASSTPVLFETERRGGAGGGIALGFRAQMLPEVCWVYHEAKMAGKLLPSQEHVAVACITLLKGLTNFAIDALVDEATGFQEMRARDALVKILEKYISKETQPWVRTFDSEFYKEMFRINGYAYDATSVKRPMIFAKRTEDIYNRLAPGVRSELQRIVKRGKSGRTKEKLFQHLADNEGYKELVDLIKGVKVIMKLSVDRRDFERKLDRVYPRFGDTLQLPFDDDNE